MLLRTKSPAIVVTVALAGCAPAISPRAADPGLAAIASVRALASPAGPGSGEPSLASDGEMVLMSWLEPIDETAWALRVSTLSDVGWTVPATIVSSESFFVNWADFPSVLPLGGGRLAAHWLQRSAAGTYDYEIRIAQSDDGGATWGPSVKPHRDNGAGEHGFVSMVADADGGVRAVWLDGRETVSAPGSDDGPAGAMTLRSTTVGADGSLGTEELIDERVCDCCQTDAAWAGDRLIVVYRDRSENEIRDIHAATRGPDGWSDPVAVASDGWMIPGCPVNGPAIAARNDLAAVAWFALVDGAPEVKLAFTRDAGASFGTPVLLERGSESQATLGRVDAAWLDEHTLVVVWLTAIAERAEVRYRLVGADGSLGATGIVGITSPSRSSGFPRIVAHDGELLIAWRVPDDPARIEIRVLAAGAAAAPAG